MVKSTPTFGFVLHVFFHQGTLIFLCGGDETLFERVKGSMDGTMGKAAHFFGPVGTGSKMKLVVNMTMGTMMNSLVSGVGARTCLCFCMCVCVCVFSVPCMSQNRPAHSREN